jgi:hypothetical protein
MTTVTKLFLPRASAANTTARKLPSGHGGYVAGNFGIAAQVSEESAGIASRIKVNPPVLGEWLMDFGEGRLWLERDGLAGAPQREQLRLTKVSRLYPQYRGSFATDDGVVVDVRIFAPLGLGPETGFLSGLIVETTLKACRPWQGKVGYTLTLARKEPGIAASESMAKDADIQEYRHGSLSGLVRDGAFLGLFGFASCETHLSGTPSDLVASAPIHVDPGTPVKLTFVLGRFDREGYYANDLDGPTDLMSTLATLAPLLGRQLDAFIMALPVTGDLKIDVYLRWYVSAAILLTKGLRTGQVLTMGYSELNQRDSFWTSGIHLVFWKDLERKMILESVEGQLPSGKIPVTILPVIDRGDEIDSSEYFVLRVARYYRWHRDRELLAQAWPAVIRAVEYLHSRDVEHVGVPMQGSYWADWKDVPGVEGRKYAPHFALLWSATLSAAAELAKAQDDSAAEASYTALKFKADAFINRSVAHGGMWNGQNYVDLWLDGRNPDYVLQDQVVGGFFEVIPRGRLKSIYARLAANETTWGLRETYPYIKDFDLTVSNDGPGNFHDGGIWPYLNFVDAAVRYAHGHGADAERIIHKVGFADLEAEGDYQPGEYLNGDSGQNRGFPIQAWNAVLFSTIYFGAFGTVRVSDTEVHVHVRIPNRRNFSTRLLLPGASGILSSQAGRLTWKSDQHAGDRSVSVKIFDERHQSSQ